MLFNVFCGIGRAAMEAARKIGTGTVSVQSVRVTFPAEGEYFLYGVIIANTSSGSTHKLGKYSVSVSCNNAAAEKQTDEIYKITASANGYATVSASNAATYVSRCVVFVAGPSAVTFS